MPDPARILEALAEAYPEAGCGLSFGSPYELLVATILSAQTTDKRVNEVTQQLFAQARTPAAMVALGVARLESLVRTCGLYHAKAANILATSQALIESHGGAVPPAFEDLVSLPGVGRKTANVVQSNAFGIPALAVDTHVFRVSRKLGLATANTAEGVERELCAAIPKDRWGKAHHQLITHGRQICHARKPECSACCLATWCEGRPQSPA